MHYGFTSKLHAKLRHQPQMAYPTIFSYLSARRRIFWEVVQIQWIEIAYWGPVIPKMNSPCKQAATGHMETAHAHE